MNTPTILIVEDEKIAQKMAEITLQQLKYGTDTADNATTAINLVKQGYYNLIFMDLGLPDMDGTLAIAKIREWEMKNNRPRTPIVILTAHTLDSYHNRCLDIDIDDFLTKPLTKNSIATILERLFGQ